MTARTDNHPHLEVSFSKLLCDLKQSHPRPISVGYAFIVKFDDDILGDKDLSLEEAEDEALAAKARKICGSLINSPSPELYSTKLVAALSPIIRQLNIRQWARRRRHKKRLMLFHSAWRELVLSQLGGKPALEKWFKHHARLLKYGIMGKGMAKNKRPELSAEEQTRRERMKINAKASANPQIIRDPCKMDHEGEFRLSPLPRCAVPLRSAPKQPDWKIERDRNRRYDYNPIAVRYPDMLSSPINVTAFDFIWAEQAEADEAAFQEKIRLKKQTQFILKRIMANMRFKKHKTLTHRQLSLGLTPYDPALALKVPHPLNVNPYKTLKRQIRIRDPAKGQI